MKTQRSLQESTADGHAAKIVNEMGYQSSRSFEMAVGIQ